jgi:hypothetical protein
MYTNRFPDWQKKPSRFVLRKKQKLMSKESQKRPKQVLFLNQNLLSCKNKIEVTINLD